MSNYRVINIPEEDYDIIREYCEKEALKISKWMTKVVKEKIEENNNEKK